MSTEEIFVDNFNSKIKKCLDLNAQVSLNKDVLKKIYNEIEFQSIDNLDNHRLKYGELNRFAKLFYSRLDKLIFYRFKRYFDNENGYILNYSENDESHVLGNHKIYLSIDSSNKDIISMTKILASAMCQNNFENKPLKDNSVGEIASNFIEKISLDFFYKNNILTENDYKNIKKENSNNLKLLIRNILLENDVLAEIKLPLSITEFAKVQKRFPDKKNCDLLISTFLKMGNADEKIAINDYQKIIGEIIGKTLYENYKKAPADTLKYFKVFLFNNAEFDLDETSMLLFDKPFNEIANNYIENLNKYEKE